jgi:uncharacterized protein
MVIHSTFQESYLWLPLIGLIVGLLATMVGGSGGSVFPPILILLFNVPPQIAIATSLAAALPIGLVGTYGHQRKGNINWRIAIVFIACGFAGALTGAWITRLLSSQMLKLVLGVYLMTLGLFLLFSLETPGKKKNPEKNEINNGKPNLVGGAFGFVAGSAAGLFGTSGTAPVLAGMFSLKLPVRIIAGTSVLVVFTNTLSGLGGHFLAGQVDMTLVYLLASGSVIGSIAGPWLLGIINLDRLEGYIKKPRFSTKYGLAGFIMILGLLMIIG